MTEHVDGRRSTDRPSYPGRTHILPASGDSLGYWMKAVLGVVSLVTVVVGVTLFLVTLPTSAERAVAALQIDFQANATYNAQTFETKEDAQRKYEELKAKIEKIDGTTDDIAKNVAAIMGALGVRPPK